MKKVTNFEYVFVTRFHITYEKFSSDWTNIKNNPEKNLNVVENINVLILRKIL